MKYADDSVREGFHKNSTLLQVVCQMLESALYAHAYQLTVIASDADAGISAAVLSLEAGLGGSEEVNSYYVADAINSINKTFRRTDGKDTVKPETDDFSLLSVSVTQSVDFAQLN